MDVSIVVPFYNEEDSVIPLCEAVRNAMAPLHYNYEVLLVDDGSADATFERAVTFAEEHKNFRIVKLSNNYGQTAALYAGLENATGDIIITMDGDLQNDPADFPRFIEKLNEGYDVVLGWRESRQDKLVSRKIPSRMANWLIRQVAETPIKDNGCALRAYRGSIIKGIPLYSEMHRLLPTILAVSGARMAEIPATHHPRQFGSSKYGLSRIYKVLFDLVALKMIMTSYRLPFFGFGISAVLAGLLSLVFLATGIAHLLLVPGTSLVIYMGVSMLWAALSFALLMIGILCPLIYSRGRFKAEHLLNVVTR